ncbi:MULTISPECIES: tryptophan synthase subunit alpha [Sphingobacterium]|uniref:Tryptophan synthase alpha chain n=1 Tax=Sphingobacterium kitahiroshimense TaxID=470446 RepID=A0ABV0BUC0_9SPHI|nr:MULTISPECIES: tryptophan synthase subunit alpha [unclassified Sphingobacterium]MCS3555544.1 tryptophan synthase alpha chain [Sphingobacterium sp. JUb21]TCR02304.1 tryptophan synthase alpha chain [Sphingobacterium sp. JUb20]
MRKIKKTGDQGLLSIYYTAGYPTLDSTVTIAKKLEESGADFLEIGFPYSDPVADGPTIQHSSEVALKNGMTVEILFEQLKELRQHVTIPVFLMGYVNPLLQYGVERFCADCKKVGIDGIIVPDLPMYEYEELYKDTFEKNDVANIFIVTPQTSEERIRKIDKLSNSFIYLLSSNATTGTELNVGDTTTAYFQRIKDMQLENPIAIGFGISNKQSFEQATSFATGAIIGTAFVKLLTKDNYLDEIPNFIKSIKG